jgi:hypothetical protein
MPTRLLCLGDSHTVGQHGSDYVEPLAMRTGLKEIAADAMNGCETFNVSARLRQNFRANSEAAHAVVLVGTNDLLRDVIYTINPEAYWIRHIYDVQNTLHPSFEPMAGHVAGLSSFRENYAAIVRQLIAEPSVRFVYCVSLPPIGEPTAGIDECPPMAILHYYTKQWTAYNGAIKELASALTSVSTPIEYVPFGETLTWNLRQLQSAGSSVPYTFQGFDFLSNAATTYAEGLPPAVGQVMFGQKCDQYTSVGDRLGRYFMHDSIHFNERARDVLVELLAGAIQAQSALDGNEAAS